MTPETRAKLAVADVGGWYVPNDDWSQFPYQVYQTEVEAIRQQIKGKLGVELKKNGNIQDASYFEELSLLSSDRRVQVCIMFSSFGKLFTIWSSFADPPENLPNFDVPLMRSITEAYGWTYIPAGELNAVYDGRHADRILPSNFTYTWLIRFFSYV